MILDKTAMVEKIELRLGCAVEDMQFGVERKEERDWRGSQEGEQSSLYTHTHTCVHRHPCQPTACSKCDYGTWNRSAGAPCLHISGL